MKIRSLVVDALGTPCSDPLRVLSYIYLQVLVKSEVMFAGFNFYLLFIIDS